MSDPRQELAEKLDREFEEFLQDSIDNPSGPPMDQSFLDMDPETLAAELKQHPAFMTDFDETKPLSPAMEGLQAMKYDSDSAEFNATSYKDDGNRNFQKKKYRWAIDNYTEGIKFKTKNKELNAILYTNRAAAHFHIGNFRSSYNDVIFARKFKPDHRKALARGAQCCLELKKYDMCLKWCDDGLLLDIKDEVFLKVRSNAENLKKQQERDHRKDLAKERKLEAEEAKLLKIIHEKGIKLAHQTKKTEKRSLLASLETHHPSGARVKMDSEGNLQWPVLFLYPEFGETDFIEAFHENMRFEDHINMMFGPNNDPPGWDPKRNYTPQSIEIFYEAKEDEKLFEVAMSSTLSEALKSPGFVVNGGMPGFFILVKESTFAKDFHSKYK